MRASSMNAEVNGSIQRSSSTLSAASASAPVTVYSSARPRRQGALRRRALAIELLRRFHPPRRRDDDIFHGRIGEALAASRRHLGDALDHVHAFGHFTEHGITVLTGTLIEKIVVGEIDEKLRRSAMDF